MSLLRRALSMEHELDDDLMCNDFGSNDNKDQTFGDSADQAIADLNQMEEENASTIASN